MKKIFFILLFLLIINILLDLNYKRTFTKNNFPPNILCKLKEDIKLPNVKEGKDIPKYIYRCYESHEKMKPFKEVFDLTSRNFPDYTQLYYSDKDIDNFIQKNYSQRIYNAYKYINPDYGAARADFFRYLIIYYYGGVYMDIKSGPRQKTKDFLDKIKNKLVVSRGGLSLTHFIPVHHFTQTLKLNDDWGYANNMWLGSEWQQYVFASNPGNPVLGKVIQQVVSNIEHGLENKNYYNKGKYSVLALTGPIVFTKVINEYKNKDKIMFYNLPGLGNNFKHSLIDYKKIMKDKHYSKIKNKNVLV